VLIVLPPQDHRNPREAFAQDLCKDMKESLAQQENIILLLDGNSDMRHSPLALALSKCSLSEIILGKHGLEGPSTYQRNQTRTPIDGIWASPRTSMLAGGYLDYEQIFLAADHK